LVYVFEFFAGDGESRRPIDWMTHRAKSVDQARDHARAMLRNVKVRDQRPDLCVVKDQMGNTLSVVPAQA
jgi:hypothetical protein